MASSEEWNVPNSDDERDKELVLTSQNGENKDDIPIKVLEYYEEIEKNKVLELKVEEFRKIVPVLKDNSKDIDGCGVNERKNDVKCEEDNTDKSKDAIVIEDDEDKKEDKRANEPSEFDEFDEPEECQGHIPKRTPKSGNNTCTDVLRIFHQML
ncbi:hypothetical protein AC249_AIPGENE25150 [Exaiptasia diaphana]|nr:hypothetical protein AC249_AIPGENE25150 [Exaiptasia diaphana]